MLALLLACSSDPAPDRALTPIPPQPSEPVTEPTDVVAEATPPEIVVHNDTDAPLTFDRSLGPGAPLRIGSQGARPLPVGSVLDDVDDALSGKRIQICECDCAQQAPCPECEPPNVVQVTLQPGESYTMPWNGQLRAYLLDNRCATRFPVMAWPYVFTACSEDGRCARAAVTLPSAEPVVIAMSQTLTVQRCDDITINAQRRAGARVWQMVGRLQVQRPVAACSPDPTCVEPEALEDFLASARSQDCTSVIVPRGDRLEAMIFLPVPTGEAGGERYTHFYDPDATRLLDVRYEQ